MFLLYVKPHVLLIQYNCFVGSLSKRKGKVVFFFFLQVFYSNKYFLKNPNVHKLLSTFKKWHKTQFTFCERQKNIQHHAFTIFPTLLIYTGIYETELEQSTSLSLYIVKNKQTRSISSSQIYTFLVIKVFAAQKNIVQKKYSFTEKNQYYGSTLVLSVEMRYMILSKISLPQPENSMRLQVLQM